MECLCGMRLQSFLTNGCFVYPCNAGYGEGETGIGKQGGVEVLARAGSGEVETGRVRLGGGNGEGEGGNGKEETENGANGRGRRRGKRIGDFTDGHDEMPGWTCGMTGWNEVTEFSVFVFPVQRRVPQLVVNIGGCLLNNNCIIQAIFTKKTAIRKSVRHRIIHK